MLSAVWKSYRDVWKLWSQIAVSIKKNKIDKTLINIFPR